jgi:hypothetical protein
MGRVALVATLALLFGGCALTYTEVGREVPTTEGLEIGVTTRTQVLERFGPPLFIQRQFDGDLYTWRRLRGRERSITIFPILARIFYWESGRLLRDDVALLFDPNGSLRGFGHRLETEEQESEDR